VGLDGSSISSGAYPGFSSGGTINAEHLILTSAKYFHSAVVPGGWNSNPPPSAIPARCASCFGTAFGLTGKLNIQFFSLNLKYEYNAN